MQEKQAKPQQDILDIITELKVAYQLLLQDPTDVGDAVKKMQEELSSVIKVATAQNFTLGSKIASCLYGFIEGSTEFNTVCLKLIKAHIDAIYVIFQENITGEGDDIGQSLLEELTAITSTYKS